VIWYTKCLLWVSKTVITLNDEKQHLFYWFTWPFLFYRTCTTRRCISSWFYVESSELFKYDPHCVFTRKSKRTSTFLCYFLVLLLYVSSPRTLLLWIIFHASLEEATLEECKNVLLSCFPLALHPSKQSVAKSGERFRGSRNIWKVLLLLFSVETWKICHIYTTIPVFSSIKRALQTQSMQKHREEKMSEKETHIFINYPRYISRHNRFSLETLSLSAARERESSLEVKEELGWEDVCVSVTTIFHTCLTYLCSFITLNEMFLMCQRESKRKTVKWSLRQWERATWRFYGLHISFLQMNILQYYLSLLPATSPIWTPLKCREIKCSCQRYEGFTFTRSLIIFIIIPTHPWVNAYTHLTASHSRELPISSKSLQQPLLFFILSLTICLPTTSHYIGLQNTLFMFPNFPCGIWINHYHELVHTGIRVQLRGAHRLKDVVVFVLFKKTINVYSVAWNRTILDIMKVEARKVVESKLKLISKLGVKFCVKDGRK